MASGMVWVTPLKLPAKMIVAPNSPSAQAVSAPATSAGQGYCDPEESPPVAGPIDHGSLLYRPVYRAETRCGLPDVERGGHEDLGHHHGRGREAQGDAEDVQVLSHQAEPPECQQQRDARRARR